MFKNIIENPMKYLFSFRDSAVNWHDFQSFSIYTQTYIFSVGESQDKYIGYTIYMSGYAYIDEVYGAPLAKKRGKKKKKVQFDDTVLYEESGPGNDGQPSTGKGSLIAPLSPQEMDTELLDDRNSGASIKPFTEGGAEYQGISQGSYAFHGDHMLPYAKPMRSLGPHPNRNPAFRNQANHHITESSDDPDYLEFLQYKRLKQRFDRSSEPSSGEPSSGIEGFATSDTLTNPNEQFNELLLYMFTGFFLLMLFDNIYKLGRDAY